MKKFKLGKVSCLVFLLIASIGSVASAASSHLYHYDTYLIYDEWEYSSDGDIDIKYYYRQDGNYDFRTEVAIAAIAWEDMVDSPFDFVKTSNKSSADMFIYSDDFGDSGWTGYAYYNESPKRIKFNEYWKANSPVDGHTYTYDCYINTLVHEMGHTHGLDHYECPTDREVMIPYHKDGLDEPYVGDRQGIYDIY
ncbi:hypothetical protein [Brevibacillus reuszeri]|uniref:hypothetical protein n=1 Tax=Brevibacillus reuszeri TaxID=54915 RepID=UPI003D19E1D9